MRKIAVSIAVYLCLIFTCFSISAQEFKTIQSGIEYAEMTREIDSAPVKMNLLRLDLTKVRLDVVHAMDAAIGTETVSSMAKRHGAIAAINGGFFRLGKSIFAGDETGTLMINKKLLSESFDNNNSSFGRVNLMISNKPRQTYLLMERIKIKNVVLTKGKVFDVGTNRQRNENDIVIFTKSFSKTTLTNNEGIEFIVRNNRVMQIFDGKGNNEIPSNGYVISVSGNLRNEALMFLKVGTKANVNIAVPSSSGSFSQIRNAFNFLTKAEDVVGGVPQLIKNGKIEITWEQEKQSKSFVETKHPRTAVAKLKDGKFLMVTVDGRSEASGGIGLQNLAEILLELGATDAMNLDGGGSTTMFLDGKVVNKPSDKEGERRVGDAILVFPRKKN
jgi:exopolysaccharide biosynthesis protein